MFFNNASNTNFYCKEEFISLYCYGVEYIENGILCSDIWSKQTLIDELQKGEVQIISVLYKTEWGEE